MTYFKLVYSNPKPFWGYIGAQTQDNSGVSPLLKQGALHTDNLSKAKIRNDQFSSVFTREDTTDIPHHHNPAYKDIPELYISQKGVDKMLRNVKASKASYLIESHVDSLLSWHLNWHPSWLRFFNSH